MNLFYVGQCYSKKCKSDLHSELQQHQDIVQGDFMDSYYNTTLKFTMGLKYIVFHCNTTHYLLMIDGDYSLNVPRYIALFLKHYCFLSNTRIA